MRDTLRDTRDTFSVFLDEGPTLVGELRDGAAFPDVEALQRAARRLRALAVVNGADWLAELCRDLDARARYHGPAGVADLLARVESEHERVRLAVRRGEDAATSGEPRPGADVVA